MFLLPEFYPSRIKMFIYYLPLDTILYNRFCPYTIQYKYWLSRWNHSNRGPSRYSREISLPMRNLCWNAFFSCPYTFFGHLAQDMRPWLRRLKRVTGPLPRDQAILYLSQIVYELSSAILELGCRNIFINLISTKILQQNVHKFFRETSHCNI